MTAQFYSCDLNTTPSRKRKRQFENFEEIKNATQTTAAPISCFTNAAFCSTPKKIVAKRRSQLNKNKENIKANVYPEDTPIAENKQEDASKIPQNPFEVLRKPPKKKKRHTEELACFENQALNLDIPEKLFNPYEVVREITDNKKSNCFSNPALNLKAHDASILCNPFEVQRQAPNHESLNTEFKSVSKNPFILSPDANEELTTQPCQLKLGLPFAPKLGCRIDFKDVSISQLTPSKLLAEKLVFSPVKKPKISLDSIEEESPMDIGNELDRYQLELENSINEAKLQKAGAAKEYVTLSPDNDHEIKLPCKQKSIFIQQLYVIPENVDNKQVVEEAFKETECNFNLNIKKEQSSKIFQNDIIEGIPVKCNLNKQYQKTETAEVIAVENLDELYGSCTDDKDDSFDFIAPAPFVRAYTKQEIRNLTVSKQSLEPSKYGISGENDKKRLQNVKHIIRKSIRKLVHTPQHGQLESNDGDNPNKGSEQEKQKGLMNAIRSSFRRKSAKDPNKESEIKNEISIIDCSERTMKLKTDVLYSEYMNIEDLSNERTPNLRSSIRKSTRGIRNQLLKSVFHKHEEYDFRK